MTARLILDENLSERWLPLLERRFPSSVHLRARGRAGAADRKLWEHAAWSGRMLVTKDEDFVQMSAMHGDPPQKLWLNVGNAGIDAVARLLRTQVERNNAFIEDPEAGLLALGFAPGAPWVRSITGGQQTATLQLSAVLKITEQSRAPAMTRFVADSSAVLHLVSTLAVVSAEHQLLAPTLLRSQTLSALHEAVHRGELTPPAAREQLARVARLPIRLLGDAVLRRRAWDIADQLGWPTTFDAEYIALTPAAGRRVHHHAPRRRTRGRQRRGSRADSGSPGLFSQA